MIVFDLQCRDGGETFEAWFRSSSDYDEQSAGGLVECPLCGSTNVGKAPMAPRVPRKGSGDPLARLAAAQAEMLKHSRWVGDKFAETARAIHAGQGGTGAGSWSGDPGAGQVARRGRRAGGAAAAARGCAQPSELIGPRQAPIRRRGTP